MPTHWKGFSTLVLLSFLGLSTASRAQKAQQQPQPEPTPAQQDKPTPPTSPTEPSTQKPSELPPVVVIAPSPPKGPAPAKGKPKKVKAIAVSKPVAAVLQQASAPQNALEGSPNGSAREPVSGYAANSALSATKTDTPLIETPQAVSVVPKDLIQDRKAQDVNDALRTVPSFSPANDFLFDETYTLRGFLQSTQGLYQKYRDGRRSPQTVPISPDLLERIEVIKGPASVLYGQVEPGGLINHVSKRALTDFTGGYVQQDFSSFDQFKTIVDVNAAIGNNAAIRLPGAFSTGDSFRDFVDYQNFDIAPAATWKVSPGTRISVLTTFGHRDRTDDMLGKPIVNGTILNVPRSRFLGEPSFDDKITYGTVTTELETKIAPGLTWRSAYSYFNADRDIAFALNTPFPFDGTNLQRFGGAQSDQFTGHALQSDLLAEGTVLGMQNTALVGFDALWAADKDLANIGFLNPINVNNPNYDPTVLPPFIFDQYRGDISSNYYGIYVQDQVTVLRDLPGIHKLIAMVGGRWDFTTDVYDPKGQFFFSTPTPGTILGNAFSPRAALLWMPVAPLSIYGSYSQSFNPQDPQTVGFYATPPDPSFATQYEVGAKYDVAPNLQTSVALFDITKTNIPGTDPNNPLLSVLTGAARSRGVEFQLTGRLGPGWDIAAGLSFLNPKIIEDTSGNVGKRLAAAPDANFGLWSGYTFQPGTQLAGFGFGAGVTYLSDVFYDNANTIRLPSYTLYDAALWYRPGISYQGVTPEYSLNVKNLTDEHYFIAGNGFSAVHDGTARTVIGSVKMKF